MTERSSVLSLIATTIEIDEPVTENMLVIAGSAVIVGMSGGATQGGGAVLVSEDSGETWVRRTPRSTPRNTEESGPMRSSMGTVTFDRESGRLFVTSCFDPTVAIEGPWAEKIAALSEHGTYSDTLAYSDDLGLTWTIVQGAFPHGGDWGKTFLGPPATASAAARLAENGYPNVVYHCMGATYSCVDYCWRSLDGGDTWELTDTPVFNSYIGRTPLPYGDRPDQPEAGDRAGDQHTLGGIGVVLDDGTILVPANICGHARLYRSVDDGDTWEALELPGVTARSKRSFGDITGFQQPPNGGRPYLRQQPFHRLYGSTAMSSLYSQQLATDREGTLAFAWIDARDDLPYLITSTDSAEMWSEPIGLAAPDVDMACIAAVAIGPGRRVAVASYGSTDGGYGFDGRLAVVDLGPTDASTSPAPGPVVHHARTEGGLLQPNGISEPIEFVGCAIDDDGVAWASFARDTAALDPRSPAIQADGNFRYNGDRYSSVVLRAEFASRS